MQVERASTIYKQKDIDFELDTNLSFNLQDKIPE